MVELDRLNVIFESKGAEKVISELAQMQKHITSIIKSYNSISNAQKNAWKKISEDFNKHSKNMFQKYDEEIKRLEEIKKLRKEAYNFSNTDYFSSSQSINNYSRKNNPINRVFPWIEVIKSLFNVRNFAEQKRQETYIRYNQEQLTGSKASNAVGYDIALTKYGAVRGEGLESLRNFSVGLGAATRGDISLLRTLGKWGIGGINPQDDPISVAKAIAQRARGLSKNERLAMYSEVGFTDAQAMAAEKGDWGMFKKSGSPLSIQDVVREATEEYSKTTQSLIQALSNLNETFSRVTPALDKLVSYIPELTIAISSLVGTKAFFNNLKSLIPGNTSLPPPVSSNPNGKKSVWKGMKNFGKNWGIPLLLSGAKAAPFLGGLYLLDEMSENYRKSQSEFPYSDLDSAMQKIDGIKSDNRGYWKRNWDNLKNIWYGLPFDSGTLVPDWIKNGDKSGGANQLQKNYQNIYGVPQASNQINQTFYINGNNAEDIGNEISRILKNSLAV